MQKNARYHTDGRKRYVMHESQLSVMDGNAVFRKNAFWKNNKNKVRFAMHDFVLGTDGKCRWSSVFSMNIALGVFTENISNEKHFNSN